MLQPIIVDNYTQVFMMTEAEALDWKKRVGSAASELRIILHEGYTREAWRALGFSNWTECIKAIANEFGFSERQIWYLHSANMTENNLLNNCSVGKIPESQLRPLASLPPEQQREVWTKAIETAPNGKITAAHVQGVVYQYNPIPPIEKAKEEYRHVSDDSYEWYTPQEYIDAARLVMGTIDLDPASCQEAQRVVRAKKFYSKEDDGLVQKWHGCIYLNPPYCMPDVEKFIEKTVLAFDSSEIQQAIVLTNNSTDAGWFHKILNRAGIACFTRGRVKYWGPNTSAGGARQGQVFFYLGKNVSGFVKYFSQFGAIVKAV